MQYLKLFPAFLLALFLFTACSGAAGGTHNSAATDSASASTAAASGAPSDASASLPGNATWSATIDGQAVTGTGIDGLQQRNAAYQIPGSANEKTLLFYLFDTKDGADNAKFTHSMRFYLPYKEGAEHIDRSSPDHGRYGITVNLVPDDTHAYRYFEAGIDVTFTAITASHVTGTFSGKFTVSPDSPNAPKSEIIVTDGKFDIPMATSKLIPS
jgi:hypothetical protein